MASLQEILDNALPGELIFVNNYGHKSKAAFETFCVANGITEIDDSEIVYRRANAGYGFIQRPFNPDLTTRFDVGTLKTSTRTELRLSIDNLPLFFFDSETGLIYFQDADDIVSTDDGVTVIAGDGTRYKPQQKNKSVNYDPANIAAGDELITTVAVPGATLGQFANAAFSNDLQGIVLNAYVSALDTVTVIFSNNYALDVNLPSGTLFVRVY